jgi:hypothetical protein
MFTEWSLNVHWMFTECSLNARCVEYCTTLISLATEDADVWTGVGNVQHWSHSLPRMPMCEQELGMCNTDLTRYRGCRCVNRSWECATLISLTPYSSHAAILRVWEVYCIVFSMWFYSSHTSLLRVWDMYGCIVVDVWPLGRLCSNRSWGCGGFSTTPPGRQRRHQVQRISNAPSTTTSCGASSTGCVSGPSDQNSVHANRPIEIQFCHVTCWVGFELVWTNDRLTRVICATWQSGPLVVHASDAYPLGKSTLFAYSVRRLCLDNWGDTRLVVYTSC